MVPAAVPVTTRMGLPAVPVLIDGKPAELMLDTGAGGTILTAGTAARLGLPVPTEPVQNVRGIGGTVRTGRVTVGRMQFGTLSVPGLPVAILGPDDVSPELQKNFDGFLGVDVLSRAAIELDLPGQRVVVHGDGACQPATPSASDGWGALPSWQSPEYRLGIFVTLMGRSMPALIDTGATSSQISRRGADFLGIGSPPPGMKPGITRGVGPATSATWYYRFPELRIGGELIERPRFRIVEGLPMAAEMVIGADFLSRRSVWLSYATGQVFVRQPLEPGPLMQGQARPVPP